MRHKSVDAFMTYQRSGTKESKSNRLSAVLQLPDNFNTKKTKGSDKNQNIYDPNDSEDDNMDTKMPAASHVTPLHSSKRTCNSNSTLSTNSGVAKVVDLEYWNVMSFQQKKDSQ